MVLLCICWFCWCLMHSLLIHSHVASHLKKAIPGLKKYYRFLYNGFSFVTLLPLVFITRRMGGDVVFAWSGYGHFIQLILIIIALYLFWGGAKVYDLQIFLGLKQYRTGKELALLTKEAVFTERGVFAITRHPWYLGTLLLIWSLPTVYPKAIFLAAGILSIYLVVGTILEEQRLVVLHGDKYREYMDHVSMLLPWKWVLNLFHLAK